MSNDHNSSYESIPLIHYANSHENQDNSELKEKRDIWLDRIVTALVVTLVAIIVIATATGETEIEESSNAVQYRPSCKVPSNRYSHNIRVIQTSLGDPTQKWTQLECMITTKRREQKADSYGAPDAILSVQLDSIAHPNRPPILGFGGAFTEASALNFRSLSKAGQDKVLDLLFGELGYSLGRVHINSCDFSIQSYAYDTVDGDFNLTHFSIEHDLQSGMIDMMQRAKQAYARHWNVDHFKLYASPWSPPAWMKAPTPDDPPEALHAENMTNSAQPVCLREGVDPMSPYAKAWALYFAKFLQSYQAEGLDFFAVTVQNEPEFPAPWEACSYNPQTQADFIRYHLGPQLAKSFPKTKIFIFDHNKDHAPYWIDTIMKDKEVAKYVGGTAYHWYAGSMDRLLDGAQGAPNMHRIMAQLDHIFLDQKTLDSHHNRDTSSSTGSPIPHIVLGSEACHCPTTGYAGGDIAVAWARAERYAHSILADLAAGSQGWVEWNLLLDAMGGPNHLGNLCDASLLAVPHRAVSANDTTNPPIDFQHGRRPFGRIVGEGRTREELNALGFPASLLDMGIVAQPLFYYMGHISRYVRPGSHAIPAIAVEGSTSSLQTVFRTQDGVAGGGENNLARQGIELTVWPCEGSTRQQFVWDDTSQQIQVLGHDWLGIPTVSCVGRQNDKDFLGVQLGSCNVTDAFAGIFEKVDVVSDDDNDNNMGTMRLQLMNFQSDDNEKRCLMIQKLRNNGGANGPRGGAQVAIGGCDSDASLWNWDNGEVSSTYMDEGKVCMTTGWPFLQVGAFDTPGPNAAAEKAVVVLNEASQSANYILKDGNTIIMSGSIPPHSIQTILID